VTEESASKAHPITAGRLGVHLAALAAATLAVAVACSLLGEISLTWPTWQVRMLRLAAAAIVGAALASAGMALQGLLRNPLAEPYILGISSGAGVGVLLGLAATGEGRLPGWATTPVLALAGALGTCGVVYGIAQRRGRLDPYVLLLSGVIVNAFNGAIMLSIWLLVPRRIITDFAFWAMGGISEKTAITNPWFVLLCAAVVLGGWAVLFARGSAFNTLGLGDDVAGSMGVSVSWLRLETFVIVALMTAAAVALAGPIGFLGLIIPHICRLIVGPDHRRLAVVCGFAGAMFLMVADTLCRLAGGYLRLGEIPVGILTALTGGPFFIYLLRSRRAEAMA